MRLRLVGVQPRPLGGYLKALGVLRLVATQADQEVYGWFDDGVFNLNSRLDEADIRRFFLEVYQPSPIFSPWNGDSGFDDSGRAVKELGELLDVGGERVKRLREAVDSVRRIRPRFGEKPKNEAKALLILALRSELPDDALFWIDAAWALRTSIRGLSGEPSPLLGAGGNDGRLDFGRLFARSLLSVLPTQPGGRRPRQGPSSEELLEGSLRGTMGVRLVPDLTGGRFVPGSVGGPNATTGDAADPLGNPWDVVLMLEGTLLWGATAVRHLRPKAPSRAAFPFTFLPTVGGPGVSDADVDKATEVWAPVWEQPATLGEVASLFREGRAEWRGRQAVQGLDVARSARSLGVQRGIARFERYGLQVRNGMSYLAVPLGAFDVADDPAVRSLGELDRWLTGVDRALKAGGANALKADRKHLDDAFATYLRSADPRDLGSVLEAISGLEWHMAMHADSFVTMANAGKPAPAPLPKLPRELLDLMDDGSPAFRLACAFASQTRWNGTNATPVFARQWVEPVRREGKEWVWSDHHPDGTPPEGQAVIGYLARVYERVLRPDSWPTRDRKVVEAGWSERGTDPFSEQDENGVRVTASAALANITELTPLLTADAACVGLGRWLRLAVLCDWSGAVYPRTGHTQEGWVHPLLVLTKAATQGIALRVPKTARGNETPKTLEGAAVVATGRPAPWPMAGADAESVFVDPMSSIVRLLVGGQRNQIQEAARLAVTRIAATGFAIPRRDLLDARWTMDTSVARRMAVALAVPVRPVEVQAALTRLQTPRPVGEARPG